MKNYYDINKIFWDFVHEFDINNPNILKKIIHTFAVANHCFDAACSLNFNEEDRMFCYMMGMFHDLGRFEQWTKYQTYADEQSENHGIIGRRIFESRFTPKSLELTQERYDILANTIQYHIIEFPGDDKELWKFLNIIHSADAYDNLLNTSLGSQILDNFEDGYSEIMLTKFLNNEKVYKIPCKTKLDRLLKSLGNAYCLSIDYMRQDIISKNYFNVVYQNHIHELNKEDQKIFTTIIDHLNSNYIVKK